MPEVLLVGRGVDGAIRRDAGAGGIHTHRVSRGVGGALNGIDARAATEKGACGSIVAAGSTEIEVEGRWDGDSARRSAGKSEIASAGGSAIDCHCADGTQRDVAGDDDTGVVGGRHICRREAAGPSAIFAA